MNEVQINAAQQLRDAQEKSAQKLREVQTEAEAQMKLERETRESAAKKAGKALEKYKKMAEELEKVKDDLRRSERKVRALEKEKAAAEEQNAVNAEENHQERSASGCDGKYGTNVRNRHTHCRAKDGAGRGERGRYYFFLFFRSCIGGGGKHTPCPVHPGGGWYLLLHDKR